MKLFNIFKLFLMVSIFLCLFSACDYSNKQPIDMGDGGFLSGKPCSAPCFHNIIPGVTTEKKALETLSVELDVNYCDHWDKNNNIDKGMRCQQGFGITFNDLSVVNVVSFQPSQIITADEVIKKYGEPDAVLVTYINPSNKQPSTVSMMFYYDRINAMLRLAEQNSDSNKFDLKPTTLIERIVYSDQNSYKLMRRYFQEWSGYGQYSAD